MIPYAINSDTSAAAAESMMDSAAGLRQRVRKLIHDSVTGLTCDAIEAVTGLRHQTASARVHELMRSGDIVDSGKRERTRSGRKAVVWVIGDGVAPAVTPTRDWDYTRETIRSALRIASSAIGHSRYDDALKIVDKLTLP